MARTQTRSLARRLDRLEKKAGREEEIEVELVIRCVERNEAGELVARETGETVVLRGIRRA
jgi:hypothetical protein